MPEKKSFSRRDFLTVAGGVAALALVSGGYTISRKWREDDYAALIWRLNPAFTLRTLSSEEIELVTTLADGKKLRHRFQGLDADIFRQVAEEKKVGDEISSLAHKYGLQEKECRRRILRSMKEFAGARLIYSGERMKVKVVESNHG